MIASNTNETKRRRLERGFSLIELTVVLVILGLIVGIVAPNIWRRLNQGKVTTAKAQIEQISSSIASFTTDMGRFPTSDEGLKALIDAPEGSELWAGPYLNKRIIPKDPWNNDYIYRYPGTHNNEFDLFSKGADAQEGTEDDIANWK